MNINEQELSEAVDKLREGETVLGLTDEHITAIMSKDPSFNLVLLNHHLDKDEPQKLFEEHFNDVARYHLREALRAHLEQQAGLM